MIRVYNKSRCFETFPFPDAKPDQLSARIRDLAEQLDAHRKRQQAQHADLTLTGMYNVLEKLKTGEPLTAKEKVIHEQGLVAVLKTLHDELDRAVLDAYGWSDLAPLMEVVNGNAAPSSQRGGTSGRRATDVQARAGRGAARTARGAQRRARGGRKARPDPLAAARVPDSGVGPAANAAAEQVEIETGEEAAVAATARRAPPVAGHAARTGQSGGGSTDRCPRTAGRDAIAACFTGRGAWKKRLPQIIDTLVAVGRVRKGQDGLAVIA